MQIHGISAVELEWWNHSYTMLHISICYETCPGINVQHTYSGLFTRSQGISHPVLPACAALAFDARCYSMAWVHIPSGTVGRLDDVIGHGQWWPSRLPSSFVARLLSRKLTGGHGHYRHCVDLFGEVMLSIYLFEMVSESSLQIDHSWIHFGHSWLAAWNPRECVKKHMSPRYTKTRDT